MKKNTLDYFIARSKEKHLDKYDYSSVDYKNSKTKVNILCKEHGYFLQLPINHVKGSGCPSCKGVKKLSTIDFIIRSNEIHNYKFNYNLVKFENNDSYVDIICEEHGIFNQRVSSHLSGNGCNKCNYDDRRTDIDDFINRSNIVHSNRYDYSLVEYNTTNKKVKIICKEHGVFEKPPKLHLRGEGCMSCNHITEYEFIEMCKIIHNNKYDYNIVNYIDKGKKLDIICDKHGIFSQRADSHIRGKGCISCSYEISVSKPEKEWLDSLNIKDEYRQYKIDKYIVDGYDPDTNMIYEFNGDFWHGNPSKYNELDINPVVGKTFGKLYRNTINKENRLRKLGYNVISIWEDDYKKIKSNI